MGNRVGASIQFGGQLPEEKVQDLLDLLEEFDLKAEWCDQPCRENLSFVFADGEVNYGNLDELQGFAIENGLHYRYWCDGYCGEWSEQTEVYDPTQQLTYYGLGDLPTVAIDLQRIRAMRNLEEVIAYGEKLTGDLPPLKIIEREDRDGA